ncbi:MAG: DUF2065 domain-containing protein [Thermodesulfobacteriota bacterium]
MEFNLHFFLTALGLAFILEGLPYFIWAERMPAILALLAEQPTGRLRRYGLLALIGGLALIALARSLL